MSLGIAMCRIWTRLYIIQLRPYKKVDFKSDPTILQLGLRLFKRSRITFQLVGVDSDVFVRVEAKQGQIQTDLPSLPIIPISPKIYVRDSILLHLNMQVTTQLYQTTTFTCLPQNINCQPNQLYHGNMLKPQLKIQYFSGPAHKSQLQKTQKSKVVTTKENGS